MNASKRTWEHLGTSACIYSIIVFKRNELNRKCIQIATMKTYSMKSYFIDIPSLKEVLFIKCSFCQYPAPFSFPNLCKKQAHLMNL